MPAPAKPSRLTTLATVLTVVAALYLAKEVLIPVALAALLSFALAPLVVRLQALVGRIAAVVTIVVLVGGALGGVGYLVGGQLTELAQMVPQYRENISAKLGSLRVGVVEKTTQAMKEIGEDVQQKQTEQKEAEARNGDADAQRAVRKSAEPEPAKVQVVEPEPTPFDLVAGAFAPLLGPLGTAGMVIVLVIFMLLAREDLRDRIVRLMGRGRIRLTTEAMDEAADRVSRYLFMQAVLNAVHGAAVAVGMLLLGVPGFFLWGLLSAVLRFVPYIGPWIAAAMPVLLAFAVFDGWTWPLVVVGFFVAIELLSNNVLEPWLYGTSAGVSPLAVVVSAIFWTWLWGPVGLLLSTPITVCLVVIGKHIPQLRFMHILFGDEPVLEPHARFYQRLVAMNQEEAADVAEAFLVERGSLVDTFDEVVLPALALAEVERHAGELDETRSRYLHAALREIAGDLGELAAKHAGQPVPELPPGFSVLVLPANDEADEFAGLLLAQLVRAGGGRCEASAVAARSTGLVDVLQRHAADAVVVSAVPPSAVAHARHVHMRLRARFPELAAVIGLWTRTGQLHDVAARFAENSDTTLVATLRGAMVELQRLSRTARVAGRA